MMKYEKPKLRIEDMEDEIVFTDLTISTEVDDDDNDENVWNDWW